jgi:hypothetical protein
VVTVSGRQTPEPIGAPGDFPPPAASPYFAGPSAESPGRLGTGVPAVLDPKPFPSPSTRSPELPPVSPYGARPYSTGEALPAVNGPAAYAPPAGIAAAPGVACGPLADTIATPLGQRVYGSVDYLLFWIRDNPTPPLVQVIPAQIALMVAQSGDLPPGSTTDIFAGDGTDPGSFNGFRARAGIWLNPSSTVAVEGSYFRLFKESDSFATRSEGVPVIGRAFVDVAAARNAFLFYALPDGSQRGFINVNAPTELDGFEVNLRVKGYTVFSDRQDLIGGFRYLELCESVTINSGASFPNPGGLPPTTITSTESFRTENQFYGSQIGLETFWGYRCFTLELIGKIAFGFVQQDVTIEGTAQMSVPGQPVQTFPNESILFVQPTNAGRFERNFFAVLPEMEVKLGYQVTPNIRATVGYDILALSNVIRPGSAIDVGVNPANTRFIATSQPDDPQRRPSFVFNGTDFWAQGLTLGVTVTY